MRKKYQSGFTLIELAVVLLVISIIVSSGLLAGTALIKSSKVSETRARLELIEEALEAYHTAYGVLPCPARRSSDVDTANFGLATDCTAGVVSGVTDVGSVRIGVLPVRTLNLPTYLMFDAWASRFLYAVTELHATVTPSDYSGNDGAISIVDSAENSVVTPADTASYIVVSHGLDHKGSYAALNGDEKLVCPTSGSTFNNLDVYNCDDSDAKFRIAMFNDGDIDTAFYDDVVQWGLKFGGTSSSGSAFPTGTLFVSTVTYQTDLTFPAVSPTLRGYLAANAICDDQQAGSRMASYEDFVKHLPAGTIVGAGRIHPSGHGRGNSVNDCKGYTDNTNTYNGDTQYGMRFSSWNFSTGPCGGGSKLLCFKPD